MNEDSVIKELTDTLPQVGSVAQIIVRPGRKELPLQMRKVTASKDAGLEEDHFSSTYSKKRQVTLIQQEHIEAVASMLGKNEVDSRLLRRNIVVKGINLLALKDKKVKIGEAILEITGYCHPCSRMEENLGPGGYNAMRGHGGMTAMVIEDGTIGVGDEVRMVR
jgi:MOSC domain-containing protein YiiM